MCLSPVASGPVGERMTLRPPRLLNEYEYLIFRYNTSSPMLHKQQLCSKRQADKKGGGGYIYSGLHVYYGTAWLKRRTFECASPTNTCTEIATKVVSPVAHIDIYTTILPVGLRLYVLLHTLTLKCLLWTHGCGLTKAFFASMAARRAKFC